MTGAGVRGDHNHARTDKLGSDPERAVLILPLETLLELAQLGWSFAPGALGENVTSVGLRGRELVGRRYRVGATLELVVTQAARPCRKLAAHHAGDGDAGARLLRALVGRRGWFASVAVAGRVTAGDPFVEL